MIDMHTQFLFGSFFYIENCKYSKVFVSFCETYCLTQFEIQISQKLHIENCSNFHRVQKEDNLSLSSMKEDNLSFLKVE